MGKLLTISEARNELADTVNHVAYTKQRVVIGRRGKRLVAVVPVEDLDRLERLDDEADARAARAAVRKIKSGKLKTVPWEQVRAPLGD